MSCKGLNEPISDRIVLDTVACQCEPEPDDCEKVIYGTGLKFSLKITANGFDMNRDEFKVVFTCGDNNVSVRKEEMIISKDDEWIVSVDTESLGVGKLKMTTVAYVPDDGFPTGIRKEVDKRDLLYIKEL